MPLYALTIFVSAFLLFQVQPLIGKFILPWFGSTPGVWTTCMLFFQVLLLAGYAYAHAVTRRLSHRGQALLHCGLLAAAVATLPIIPGANWKPTGGEEPISRIMLLLAVTVGLPYFLLSTTGPLLQAWFAKTCPGKSPYRLYALSNVGSLLALLSYPVLVEPNWTLARQATVWSWGYAAFAVLCGMCAYQLMGVGGQVAGVGGQGAGVAVHKSESAAHAAKPMGAPPSWIDVLLWLGLSASASVMLLATTNQLCQDVAVVPFLWVLPLSLYLLTFIICFDSPRWYVRPLFVTVLPLITLLGAVTVIVGLGEIGGISFSLPMQIASYASVMFIACLCCHGELVRTKPDPRHLTLFYLMISVGGALGGVFVALVAPFVFTGFHEYHVALVACYSLVMVVVLRDMFRARRSAPEHLRDNDLASRLGPGLAVTAPLFGVGLAVALGMHATGWRIYPVKDNENHWNVFYRYMLDKDYLIEAADRNFFGVLYVKHGSKGDVNAEYRGLTHGRISHGFQFVAAHRREQPASYFGPDSGIGIALTHHPKRFREPKTLRIGVIGLGVGTIAAYALPGDFVQFYEINPTVIRWADEYFTYLADARKRGAEVPPVLLGDARIVLEQQLATGQPQKFDILVVDAFSSDAIPIHLITEQAVGLYLEHIQPDGILAVQISNRYVELEHVVKPLAEKFGRTPVLIHGENDDAAGYSGNSQILVTSNAEFLQSEVVQKNQEPWPSHLRPVLWTDDFSSLYGVLK